MDQNQPTFDFEEVNARAAEIIDDIIAYYGLELKENGKGYQGVCPIHDGADNDSSFNIFCKPIEYVSTWRCYSHSCHRTYGKSLIGLVRGLISSRNGHKADYDEAAKLIETFTGAIKLNPLDVKKREFVKRARVLYSDPNYNPNLVKKEDVGKYLLIPSRHYIQRGFTPEILKKYSVGYNANKKGQLAYRTVFPIFDNDYNFCVGGSGRTVFPHCTKCNGYHNGEDCKYKAPKWKHMVQKESILYNYWFARKEIKKTYKIYLVESPGNVLKMEMAGIHNSLAVLGSSLSVWQKRLIDGSGALEICVIGDPDEGGETLWKSVVDLAQRDYNLSRIVPQGSDLGEKTVEEIQCLIQKNVPVVAKEI